MSNHTGIGQTDKLEGTKDKFSHKWNSPVWLGITGFIVLSGAIGSLQHMTGVFADDIYKTTFIQNWMPWFAVFFFAFGWSITHWIEVVLYNNRLGLARVLLAVVLVGGFSVSAYFRFYSDHEVLRRFDSAALFMVMGGYFLRYSVFRQESVLRLQNAIFGRRLD